MSNTAERPHYDGPASELDLSATTSLPLRRRDIHRPSAKQAQAAKPRRRSRWTLIAAPFVAIFVTLGVVLLSGQFARAQDSGSFTLEPGVARVVKGASLTDGLVTVKFTTAQQPSGGGFYQTLESRMNNNSGYLSKVRVYANGTMRLTVVRVSKGAEQAMGSVLIPQTYSVGSWVRSELLVSDEAPVLVRARVWLDGTAQPDWQVTGQDDQNVSVEGTGNFRAYASRSGSRLDVNFAGFSVGGDAQSVLAPPSTLAANQLSGATTATSPAATPSAAASSKPTTATAKPSTTATTQAAKPTATATTQAPATQAPAAQASATQTQTQAPATQAPTTQAPAPVAPAPVIPAPVAPAPVAAAPAGKPGAGNTGVPAGTNLTPVYNNITVTEAGKVLDSLDVHGYILVKAPNVTIKNTLVRGNNNSGDRGKAMIHAIYGASNLVIEDSTLIPDNPTVHSYGIKGGDFTARRLNIAKNVDSIEVFGNNVRIENSWLHDHIDYASDPAQGGQASHNDGVQVMSGNNITLSGNTITGASNAAVQVTQDNGAVSNLTMQNNFFDNGTCSVKMDDKPRSWMGPVSMWSNKFGGSQTISGCAILRTGATSLSQSGNVWNSGQSISVNVYG